MPILGMGGGPLRATRSGPERVTVLAIYVTVAMSLLPLWGWLTDEGVLRSILPRHVAMNPATALCFLISAASLWLLRRNRLSGGERWGACLGACIVLLAALIKLGGVVTGRDIWLDQALFPDRLATEATLPANRMAPNTALGFLFLGAALLALGVRGTRWAKLSQGLAAPPLLLGALAFLGYVYGAKPLYGVPAFIPMAFNTAILFMLMAAGVVFARPRLGLPAILMADDPGGHLFRRLLPIGLTGLAVSGWLELKGEAAGLYDAHSMISVLNLLFLTIVVYASARSLSHADKERRDAGKQLRKARDELEERIAERTSELEINARLMHENEERRRAEEALAASERYYRLLFDENPQPMWVYDRETLAFLAVNQAAVRQYGYSPDEFLAMTIKDIRPEEDVPVLIADARHATPEQPGREWKHRRKDGSLLDVQIWADRLPFAGRTAGLILAVDITEQKKLEAQLQQAQKMEAVGRLAGGVAHDFNNLLTVILSYSQFLQTRLGVDHPSHKDAVEIHKAGKRAESLTRQLLAFSRQQVVRPKVLELGAVVEDLQKMLRRLLGEDIELVTDGDGDLGKVRADVGQIEQVIMNLAVNARDAMPTGGALSIETRNVDLTEAYARTHLGVSPGRYVMLAVSDSGQGISPEIRSRIFDPFFTTKEVGKGTGLGLSTVFGIVKQSAGHVEVYSEPGWGATFKVYLPRVDEEAEPQIITRAPRPQSMSTETVLLVEDDEMVREVVRDGLQHSGYEVIAVSGAAEAIQVFETDPPEIDLLVTDAVMPGMSGPELAQSLRARGAIDRILYISGHTAPVALALMEEDPQALFLQKPFTPEVLAAKVREALELREAA